MTSPLDRLSRAVAAAVGALKGTDAESGGVHVHEVSDGGDQTHLDGGHAHLFRVPTAMTFQTEDGEEYDVDAGAILVTQEDGPHVHAIADGTAQVDGSAHRHVIVIADDEVELITEKGGEHGHALGRDDDSSLDGVHDHVLVIADLALRSLTSEEASKVSAQAEEDVRIANVAVGRTTLVVDPIDDVRRLSKLDPALRALADSATIDDISDGVLKARAGGRVPVVVWQADVPAGALPVLKVADPMTIVGRLRDGKTAGLLSRLRRVARVGKAQALVNEIQPGGRSFVWGIVAQGEPSPVAKGIEDWQRESVGTEISKEFEASDDLWYVPLELGIMFDPPLELRAPPVGRQFAGTIDFSADVVKSRQLTIDQALLAAARGDVAAFVENPVRVILQSATDGGLVEIDRALHGLFDVETDDAVVRAHALVLDELENRNVQTVEVDELSKATTRLIRGRPVTESELTAFGKARGDGHVHELPGGGLTQSASGRGHVHGFGDGLETGPPLRQGSGPNARHRHQVVVGGDDLGTTGTERKPTGELKADGDGDGMVVQSLIFSKETFDDAEAARDWAEDHGFKTDKVDETETSFRLRQREPGEFRGGTLRTIDLTDGVQAVVGRLAAEKSMSVRIVKADDAPSEERYVFGVILVPEEPDAQGDIYSGEEVRKAAHSFMEHYGGDTFKAMHDGEPVDGVVVLETYLSKVEETYGGETFPVGTWFLAVRVANDDIWAAIQSGAFTGFSMGGTALREPLHS